MTIRIILLILILFEISFQIQIQSETLQTSTIQLDSSPPTSLLPQNSQLQNAKNSQNSNQNQQNQQKQKQIIQKNRQQQKNLNLNLIFNQDKIISRKSNQNQKGESLIKQILNCIQYNVLNISQCSKCKANYFLTSTKQCVQIPKNCQNLDQKTGLCTKCKDNLLLENNFCYDLYCILYEYGTQKCMECQEGYLLNGNNNCVKMEEKNLDQNCVQGEGNECKRCKQGYYVKHLTNKSGNGEIDKNQTKCMKIPEGCKLFQTQLEICIQCLWNYTLSSENKCLIKNQTTKNSGLDMQSKIIDFYCKNYQNGKCKQCFERYYLAQSMTCQEVNPLCKDYMSNGRCTQCYPGYTLQIQRGNCIFGRQTNCKIKINSTHCVECYQNYYLNSNSRCQLVNPLCRTYNLSNGNCLSCYSGYQLVSNTCQSFIKDPNCKTVDKSSKCIECYNRYYLIQDMCILVNPLCKTFDEINGHCTSCYEGYSLVNNGCGLKMFQEIKNCRIQQKDVCILCADNYYFNKNGVCIERNPLCKTFNTNDGKCKSCYDGYKLQQTGQCKITPPQISTNQNCQLSFNSTHCSACYDGYYVLSGKCFQINNLCRTINSSIGKCMTCYTGYILINGSCQSLNSITNIMRNQTRLCIKFVSGICSQCSAGYYLNSNKNCIQYDPLCKTYDQRNGDCESCYDGYILNVSNKKCQIMRRIEIPFCESINQNLQLCQSCMSGYYLAEDYKSCKFVSLLCAKYVMETGKCLQCRYGYFLQDSQCIFPAMGIDPNCLRLVGAFCNKCRDGYELVNYRCIQILKI